MNTIFNKSTVALFAAAVLCTASVASAVTQNIDTFDVGIMFLSDTGTGPWTGYTSGLDADEVIGGARRVVMSASSTEGRVTFAVVGGTAFPGTTSYSAGYYGTWSFQYGYDASGGYTDLNADLSDAGANTHFHVQMLSADHEYEIEMFVRGAGGETGTYATGVLAATGSATDIWIPFSAFGYDGWSDVDQIQLTLRGTDDGDYQINFEAWGSLSSVPEPMTMVMVMLGVGGTGAYLRRRLGSTVA